MPSIRNVAFFPKNFGPSGNLFVCPTFCEIENYRGGGEIQAKLILFNLNCKYMAFVVTECT